MKDTVFSVFIFLVTFAVIASIFVGFYYLYLLLVPGGKGLIFSQPLAAALLPALVGGMLFALFHAVHNPGKFVLTYCTLTLLTFLILSLSLPIILKMPSVVTIDQAPLRPNSFIKLADDSSLYRPMADNDIPQGQFLTNLVFIPSNERPMAVVNSTQYDPFNYRFIFSTPVQTAIPLKETSYEEDYFKYSDLVQSLQNDFFKIYLSLKNSFETDPLRFYLTCFCLSLLLIGLLFFFNLKTWPLIQWIFVLIVARVLLAFISFCLWSVPYIVEPWFSSTSSTFYKLWTPVFLIGLAGSSLFFMSILTKPHRNITP